MRDIVWLNERLNQIWQLLFPEVERKNRIVVKFKGRWKYKFGHIKKLKDNSSEIAINSLFKSERVPEFIIDLTLAHELIHYMHGFNSPHEQQFRYPHQGGIVRKELVKRGFGKMLRLEREFVKDYWFKIYGELSSP